MVFDRQHDRMHDAAKAACDATQDLARAANGNNGNIIPAPTCYDILGNMKVLMWNLGEVIDFMPTGLVASLEDPRILVYDRDVHGVERDPRAQAGLAGEHLRSALNALQLAADQVELAQTAIGGQGYDAAENSSVGRYSRE